MNVFRKTPWMISTFAFTTLAALSFTLSPLADKYEPVINQALNIETSKVVQDENGEQQNANYFPSRYSTLEELYKAKVDLLRRTAQEGTVLLKNDGDTLPLKTQSSILLLGEENFIFETKQAGGTMGFTTGRTTLSKALTEDGFNVTTTASQVGENDAALVVLGRAGGEGTDLEKGSLALTAEEKTLIDTAKNSSAGKVIVLVSGDYPIEIADLQKDERIGAILHFGNAGYRGAYGFADVLAGIVSPSGRLVDTYAVNSLSSPAMENFGDYSYTNANTIRASGANKYVTYLEGIYTDYRYYETRYEDCVLGQGKANSSVGSSTGSDWNYDNEVLYPFGYGLSYTTFEKKIVGTPTVDDKTHTLQLSVEVQNTGDVAGKEVVEIYAQSPYTQYDRDNGIEKASVQLVGIAKTPLLEPNADPVTLTVDIPLQFVASYDDTTAKGYILDEGKYYFALGDDAHDAIKDILTVKGEDVGGKTSDVYTWTVDALDTETFATSPYNGNKVTNRFDDVNINNLVDESSKVTYLTRSDWQGTYPKAATLTASESMKTILNDSRKYENGSVDTAERITDDQITYVDNADYVSNYKLIDLKGESFDSEKWDALLDEMSIQDMSNMVANGRYTIPEARSISSPTVNGNDNPIGLWQKYIYSAIDKETGEKTRVSENMTLKDGITDDEVPVSEIQASMYCSEPVLAATFNTDLASEQGKMFADDAQYCGVSFTWGMGANMHRTPFGGRTSEYFSADPILAGLIGSAWEKASAESGHLLVVKHFAVNEQEANRQGVATYLDEQTLREIYLRPFEILATQGKMNGLMTSYNRIGMITSASEYDLMTGVLREEWNSTCYTITDLYSPTAGLYDGNAMLTAGTNIMLNGSSYDAEKGSYVATTLSVSAMKEDGKLATATRNACHYLLYNVVNSMAVNGITSNSHIETITPFYFPLLTALEVVFTILAAGSAVLFLLSSNRKKEEK